MPLQSKDFEKYPNKWFVETGTNVGTGVQHALNAGFENVVTIEVSKRLYEVSQEKFRENKNVKLILGDSGLILLEAIKDIDEPITFWLDGHHSKGTGRGKKSSPLLDELEQIKQHHIKNHTILIDDVRSFGIHKVAHKKVVELIKQINPKYQVTYIDSTVVQKDVLVAQVKE